MSTPQRSRAVAAWLPRAPVAAAAALLFAGCALAPDGHAPQVSDPAHYGAAPQPAQTVAAGGTAQRFDVGAEPVPQWWRLYGSDALDALVDEGLDHNATLAATTKSLAGAREQLMAQVGSSLLPSVDAGGQATRQRNLGVPDAGPQTVVYNVFSAQLQLKYTFDLFGTVRYANRGLAAEVAEQAFQLSAARRALAANIVAGAINVALLDAQIATTERLVALATQSAAEDERRVALGAASHTQALASRQSAATLAASLPALRQQRSAATHALAVLLGRTPDAAPPALELASLKLPESVPVVVPSTLLQTRPDILAADAAVQVSAARVGVATAQLLPSLSLSASMGRGGFDWPTMFSGAGAIWSLAGSLTQPLFHGGALLKQRRAAIDNYEAALEQYKATVLSAFQDVADTLAALEHDAQVLEASETAQQAGQQAFEETAARQRLGALPPSAVRASEQQALNARLDATRAMAQRLTDTAMLFQAMGTPPQRHGG